MMQQEREAECIVRQGLTLKDLGRHKDKQHKAQISSITFIIY